MRYVTPLEIEEHYGKDIRLLSRIFDHPVVAEMEGANTGWDG
jgi:hypothetical protein